MRERLADYQEQYGDLYNLEATPAEGTSYRFAKHDVEEYPDIITANMNGTPYYTTGTTLPACPPCLSWREAARLESGQGSGSEDCRKLQTAVLHPQPHLFHLQRPWVSGWRADCVPVLWEED